MWYVIHVRTTREQQIITMYDRRVKVPRESLFVMRCFRNMWGAGGEWFESESLAFPGYVFAETEDIDGLIERLKSIPDLTKMIGVGKELFPIYKGLSH